MKLLQNLFSSKDLGYVPLMIQAILMQKKKNTTKLECYRLPTFHLEAATGNKFNNNQGIVHCSGGRGNKKQGYQNPFPHSLAGHLHFY